MRLFTIIIAIIALSAAILMITGYLLLSSRDKSVILESSKHFSFNDEDRSYRISLPEKITDETAVIIGLHGFGDSSRRFAYYTGLHNVVTKHIVVYPNAIEPKNRVEVLGWNAGFCCGTGYLNNIDDAGFIMALVDQIQKDYRLKNTDVFATGFSNGAFMSQKLAEEYPDRITAIGLHSGSIGNQDLTADLQKPIPAILLHGTSDNVVNYSGGEGNYNGFTWKSFAETKSYYESLNNCRGAFTESYSYIGPSLTSVKDDTMTGYESCDAKLEIHEINGMRHRWVDWRIINPAKHTPQGTQLIVSFFESI